MSENKHPKVHVLKIYPEYYDDVANGIKTFELRKNDRDYQIGDIVLLNEYDSKTERYTGRICGFEIIYIYSGSIGLQPDYIILGIGKKLPDNHWMVTR